jgi:hypothetical protein
MTNAPFFSKSTVQPLTILPNELAWLGHSWVPEVARS